MVRSDSSFTVVHFGDNNWLMESPMVAPVSAVFVDSSQPLGANIALGDLDAFVTRSLA